VYAVAVPSTPASAGGDETVVLAQARAAETRRIELIARISPAVVAMLDANKRGGGAGVLIDERGYGLTNYHVVAGILKKGSGFGGLPDGSVHPMRVLGVDVTGDVAMFRLTGRDRYPAVPLGDSDRLRLGEAVLVMGSPFGLARDYTPSVSSGIVSGLHRYQKGSGDRLVYTDCIQTDAAVNPGNSGGPLFNTAGEVVGIVGRASFAERGRVSVGLGYAITSNQIHRFLPKLRAGGHAYHGTLGATVVDAPEGVVFNAMLDDSVAADAGVKLGDVLVRFAGRDIRSANQFASLLGTYPEGWPVEIVYRRDGTERTANVRLDRLPVTSKDASRIAGAETATETQPALTQPVNTVNDVGRAEGMAAVDAAIERGLSRVVKLYGASVGRTEGFGSGVLVSPDGSVVTVLSMMLEAAGLRVVTSDGTVYPATVVRRDETTQLALLKLDLRGAHDKGVPIFPCFAPSSSDDVLPGDPVLAVANPFKVAEGDEAVSVMLGVLSTRTMLDARRYAQEYPYEGHVLVVDAITANPGAAGGALLTRDGRWIGLIGRIAQSNLTATRLNFAIPSEVVAAFLRGEPAPTTSVPAASRPTAALPRAGYHGIKPFELGYRRKLVYVDRVARGSPAEKAGLRKDDLIVSIDGSAVPRLRVFREIMNRRFAGDQITLVVKRKSELLAVKLTLSERQ